MQSRVKSISLQSDKDGMTRGTAGTARELEEVITRENTHLESVPLLELRDEEVTELADEDDRGGERSKRGQDDLVRGPRLRVLVLRLQEIAAPSSSQDQRRTMSLQVLGRREYLRDGDLLRRRHLLPVEMQRPTAGV